MVERHRPPVGVEHVSQSGQRPQQALGHEHDHAVGADVELAAQHHASAVDQDGGEADDDGHADQRHERRAEPDRFAVGLLVVAAGAVDLGDLVLLGDEALDGGDAAQIVGQLGAQRRDLLAHFAVARLQLALEPDRPPDDGRHRHHRHPRHPGDDDEEDRADDEDGGGQLDQLVGAVVEEALELVDVVVENRHQPTGAAVLEVGHLERLHVGVGIDAQLVLDALGQPPPGQRVGILEHRLEHPDDQGDAGQHPQLALGIGPAEAGDERVLARDDDVDRGADQDRRRQVEQLVQNRVEGRQPQRAAVAAGVAEEATHGMGGRGGHGAHISSTRREPASTLPADCATSTPSFRGLAAFAWPDRQSTRRPLRWPPG